MFHSIMIIIDSRRQSTLDGLTGDRPLHERKRRPTPQRLLSKEMISPLMTLDATITEESDREKNDEEETKKATNDAGPTVTKAGNSEDRSRSPPRQLLDTVASSVQRENSKSPPRSANTHSSHESSIPPPPAKHDSLAADTSSETRANTIHNSNKAPENIHPPPPPTVRGPPPLPQLPLKTDSAAPVHHMPPPPPPSDKGHHTSAEDEIPHTHNDAHIATRSSDSSLAAKNEQYFKKMKEVW
jgi:hypothetical protein